MATDDIGATCPRSWLFSTSELCHQCNQLDELDLNFEAIAHSLSILRICRFGPFVFQSLGIVDLMVGRPKNSIKCDLQYLHKFYLFTDTSNRMLLIRLLRNITFTVIPLPLAYLLLRRPYAVERHEVACSPGTFEHWIVLLWLLSCMKLLSCRLDWIPLLACKGQC
jgi:hypothetical protein